MDPNLTIHHNGLLTNATSANDRHLRRHNNRGRITTGKRSEVRQRQSCTI